MRTEEKKQQLIDSALQLFQSKGYENVSIEEICRRNSISKPTFYKYIPAKEQVLAYYFEQVSRQAMEKASGYLAEERPAAALQTLLGSVNDAAERLGPELYRIYWSYRIRQCAQADFRSSELKHMTTDCIAILQQKSEIDSKEPPEKLAMVLLDLSEGLGMSWATMNGGFDLGRRYQNSVFSILGVLIVPSAYRTSEAS